MFGLELDRRSRAGGWGVVSNAAHPGTTLTEPLRVRPQHGPPSAPPPIEVAHEAAPAALGLFVQTVDRGLLPALYAATGPQARGGRFYGPDGLGQFTGGPTELAVYRPARDEAAAAQLWDVSERLAGVEFTAA